MDDQRIKRIEEKLEAMAMHAEIELGLQRDRITRHEQAMGRMQEIAEAMSHTHELTARAVVKLSQIAESHEPRINHLEGK